MEVELLTTRLAVTGFAQYEAAMGQVDRLNLTAKSSMTGMTAATDAAALSTRGLGTASGAAAVQHEKHSKALKEVSREARGGIASFTGLGRAMYFASNAFLGGVLIGGALKTVVDATRNAQEATDQLRTATRNTGESWSAYGAQIEGVIAKQSALSDFTKTDLTQAMTKLVIGTGSIAKAESDLALATNLARATHEDLATAETQVVQAQTGRLTTIRGLGIAIPKVTTAEDDLKNELAKLKAAHEGLTPAERDHAQALAKASDQAATGTKMIAALTDKVHGSDQAFHNSAAGGLANFHRSLDDLEVAVGTVLLPDITKVIDKLSAWMDKLDQTGQAQRYARDAATVLGDAFKAVSFVITTLDKVTGSFKNTLLLLIAIKAGSMFAGWGAALATLIGRIGAADTAAIGLRTTLAGMAGMVIPITIVEMITHKSLLNDLAPPKDASNTSGYSSFWKQVGHDLYTYSGEKFLETKVFGMPNRDPLLQGTVSNAVQAKLFPSLSKYGPYGTLAAAAAQKYGVPVAQFLRQINQESGFNPNDRSGAGALGIAQFMPGTAAGYHINPLDPNQALPAAAKMMAGLYAKYHDWGLALAAYNAGSGTVDAYLAGTRGLPSETTAYVKSILGTSVSRNGGAGAAAAGGAGSTPSTGSGAAYAAAHAHAVATAARATKMLPPGLQESIYNAQTKLALAGGASPVFGKSLSAQQVEALKQLEQAEKKALDYLDAQHATGKKLLALDQERAAVAKQLATTQRELARGHAATGYITAGGDFAIPLAVQLQQAKADALAALQPQLAGPTNAQRKLAQQVKAAAMKAIASHKLTLQGLIDAWNEVGRINAILARTKGTIDTYHAVSTATLTAGLNLSAQQNMTLRERLSSDAAHRGYLPAVPAAVGEPVAAGGTTIVMHNPHFHGVKDVNELHAQLDKLARSRNQRRGRRR